MDLMIPNKIKTALRKKKVTRIPNYKLYLNALANTPFFLFHLIPGPEFKM